VDNNLATRWSGNGDGAWIQYNLGSVRTVGYVRIAVYNGNGRRNSFDLQASTNGTTWSNVATGVQTSGTTTQEETHEFIDVDAQYIRYVGHMSNVGTFNSVTEVSIFALSGTTATPTPTPMTSTPTPTNTPVAPTPTPTATPVVPTPTPTPTTPPSGAQQIIYLPSWQGSVSQIQWNIIDYVMYAFVIPNGDGSVGAVPNPGTLTAACNAAHQNGKKCLLSFGGWNDGNDSAFEALAASSTGRSNFAQSCLDLVNQYGLDGVDFDWEYPEQEDSANYGLMVDAVRARIGGGKLITAAAANHGSNARSVQQNLGKLDFAMIMSYDGDGGAGHSPYSYAVTAMDDWSPYGLGKTFLGVPFYARPSWAGYSALLAAGCSASSDTCTYQGATNYYNGQPTIRAKRDLCAARGCRGLMAWEVSFDVADSRSLQQAMDGGTTATPTPTPVGPTPTPTATPVVPTPTPTTPPSGCTAPAWTPSGIYTGGMTVSHNGRTWRANWWTQNEEPGVTTSGVWADLGPCTTVPTPTPTSTPTQGPTPTPTATPTPCGSNCVGGNSITGYFAQWGIYGRAYRVKNIHTSGSASKVNVINYAFNNVINNQCVVGVTRLEDGSGNGSDAFADYTKGFTAEESVDGVADVWDAKLKGSWGQLKKLKAMHPGLKAVISLGGWTWSRGFSSAARPENRVAFVKSCVDAYIKGDLPVVEGAGGPAAAAGVFDGIDIDWEYPGACGLTCGAPEDVANFTGLLAEFRKQLNAVRPGLLLTIAVGAGEEKIQPLQISQIAPSIDGVNIMTYDFFGGWDVDGPTAFHSPLYAWTGMPSTTPVNHYYSDFAVQMWKQGGMPSNKIRLGVGFYGRGWTGVTNANNGLNQPATSAAPCVTDNNPAYPCEAGSSDYKALKLLTGYTQNTSTQAGTAWVFNGSTFWSYDTPSTIGTKMNYVRQQGLGGAFFWEFNGDTSNGELVTAMRNGLP